LAKNKKEKRKRGAQLTAKRKGEGGWELLID
jgi:hypothetical protein